MDKLQAFSSIVGGLYMVMTALHVVFPKVAFFQRFGAALRQLGAKDG